jgi:hypothetical protein
MIRKYKFILFLFFFHTKNQKDGRIKKLEKDKNKWDSLEYYIFLSFSNLKH